MKTGAAMAWGFLCALLSGSHLVMAQQTAGTSASVRDHGPGVATSIFGNYVSRGEWLIQPAFEHSLNRGFQYSPDELGVPGGKDFLGELRTTEGVIFVGYGLTDSVSIGVEASVARASFRKASDDFSALPARTKESGLGDVQLEATWRWREETASRPEVYFFTEVLVPHDKQKHLIGSEGVLVRPGIGVARGFRWGTLAARGTLEYDSASVSALDFGEWSVQYLRQVSRSWRVTAGLEGQIGGANNLDEVWLVTEAFWRLRPHLDVRLHNGFGLTSQADGWEPEIGLLVRLPG